MNITVCIGSSCHLKGSRQIVERLQYLIKDRGLEDRVELNGAFCMGKCSADGVSVTVNGDYMPLKPDDVDTFFDDVIIKAINA
ncbi:MAG: (2Fe-2S) ferredoxin domain-containing protein [Clostridia bacterium]